MIDLYPSDIDRLSILIKLLHMLYRIAECHYLLLHAALTPKAVFRELPGSAGDRL
jgi:hypothetical protein